MPNSLPSRVLALLVMTVALLVTFGPSGAVGQTAPPAGFELGQLDVTFVDPTLAAPTVSARVYYPATTAGTGVPVATGTWPVIAFGHGFNLSHLDYDDILGAVAVSGYIVVSPDVQNGFSVDHLEFARELAASIDFVLGASLDPMSVFFQSAGTTTGVFGHSMGGGASALVPGVYPDIDAVSGLASAETNPSAIAALGGYAGPYQVISGSADSTAPESAHQIPMYNAALGEKQWISLVGGSHCKFTDGATLCDIVSSAGSITRQLQKELAVRYLVPFFEYSLKGDLSSLTRICGSAVAADVMAGVVSNTTSISCPTMSDFRRGDVSDDGALAIDDVLSLLAYLFTSGAEPDCPDAGDVDDNGALELSDVIALLDYLFVSNTPPPAPGPTACGPDPTMDSLLCDSNSCP